MSGSVSPPPVLLIPGWSDTARQLRHCRAWLERAGWPAGHVHTMEFRDPCGSNVEHAFEIAEAVAALRALTGTDRVAAIAHSMGGLALRHHLVHGGADTVHTAVFAGTPHRGTWIAWLAWGRGGAEMRPGSEFLRELNTRPLPDTVRAVCLRTPLDTRVLPGGSAWLPGSECHTVRLPTHAGMLRHARTLQLIRRLLQQRLH